MFFFGLSCFPISLAATNQHYVISGNHIGHDTLNDLLAIL